MKDIKYNEEIINNFNAINELGFKLSIIIMKDINQNEEIIKQF